MGGRGGTQTREVQGSKGTTSQHSLVAFFGLGTESRPVEIEVRFLGGEIVTVRDVAVDEFVTVVEPR